MIMNRVEIWQMLSGEYKGEDESECICIIMMVVLTQNAPLMIIFRMCLLLLTQGNLRSMPISSHIFMPCVYQWRIRTLILSSANSQQTDTPLLKNIPNITNAHLGKRKAHSCYSSLFAPLPRTFVVQLSIWILPTLYYKANESRIRQ